MGGAIFIPLADRLQDDIRSGRRQRLPGVAQLARELGRSTKTVWKALHVLMDRGVITIHPGKPIQIVGRSSATTTAADKLADDIREALSQGRYRAGEPLPKRSYFALNRRMSPETVT